MRHEAPSGLTPVDDGAKSNCAAEDLYRRYEQRLRAWLAARIVAPQALVDDACANAWLILLARPDVCGERSFGWLRTTALHEAYRLLRRERREPPSDRLAEARPAFVPARRDDPETALEAGRALLALASLRPRQRRFMAWKVAGFRYREIQALAGEATSYTRVNRHLTRARGALRQLAEEASEAAPRSEGKGGAAMGTGCCRRCGLRPRRVRHGTLEPLCEECYREAMDKVARQLAEEAADGGRERFRKMKLVASGRPADSVPARVAPVARAAGRPLDGGAQGRKPEPNRQAAEARLRCISEELLVEARRLYERGLSMRRVADALLDQTDYASAHSAEVALRFQFKRRGWPLRTRAQARRARHAPGQDDLARAA